MKKILTKYVQNSLYQKKSLQLYSKYSIFVKGKIKWSCQESNIDKNRLQEMTNILSIF